MKEPVSLASFSLTYLMALTQNIKYRQFEMNFFYK